MKRIILVTVVLMLAAPALAVVDIDCVVDGNQITVSYDVTSEDPNLVRAFALDIRTNGDVNIVDVYDVNSNFWVYPGSISIVDGEVDDEGEAVCDEGVGPEGATGSGLDSNWVTVEMASLYAASDACHPTAPPAQGVLFRFSIESGENCCIDINENTARGGVVMEDPYDDVEVNSPGICVVFGYPYPGCWDALTQCHGDANSIGDGSGNGPPEGMVDTYDFPAFRDSFLKSYPDAAYNPCGDFTKDGIVDTWDFPAFRDNFLTSPPANCVTGDPCGVYAP